MYAPLNQIQAFEYIDLAGQQHPVLFVLDPEKKGYINATAIAKQFGKNAYHWLENAQIKDYINALIIRMNSRSRNSGNGTKSVSYNDLVIIIQGGSPEQQGTWLHPKLAVVFARWMSSDFAVWCDEQIDDLTHQHFTQQQKSSDLIPMAEFLAATEQRIGQQIGEMNQRMHQYFIRMDQRVSQMIDQRIVQGVDKRLEQMENNFCQILNNSRTQSAQETKHTLGQIYNGINKLDHTLHQQLQEDLFKPSVQETIKQTLLDYQQVLEGFLNESQDKLIQGYLVGIREQLEALVRQLQEIVPEPAPVVVAIPIQTPKLLDSLAMEIENFRTQGQSWSAIAQLFNARGTTTTSGKGKWYGSSVKKYWETRRAA